MQATFTKVDRWFEICVLNPAINHPGDDQVVVAPGRKDMRQLTFHVRQGIVKDDGPMPLGLVGFHTAEGVGFGRETGSKMLQKLFLPLAKLVQAEVGLFFKPACDETPFADGNGDERRLKTDLLHPTGQHSGGLVVQTRRQDEEPAGNAPQSRAKAQFIFLNSRLLRHF